MKWSPRCSARERKNNWKRTAHVLIPEIGPVCFGHSSSMVKILAMYGTESTHMILDHFKNGPLKIDRSIKSTWVKWAFRSSIRCEDELDAPSTTNQIVEDGLKLFNRAALISGDSEWIDRILNLFPFFFQTRYQIFLKFFYGKGCFGITKYRFGHSWPIGWKMVIAELGVIK